MKRALAVALVAMCIGVFANVATAQVPFVQVFFDADEFGEGYSETQSACLSTTGVSNLYVVTQNWNMFVQAVEYQVQFPPQVFYLGETPNTGVNDLFIGNSSTGMSIAYNLPQNGFAPILLSTLNVIGTGACNCAAMTPYAITVVGEPNGNPAKPRAVRWPDFAVLDGVGMTSLVCPGFVSTTESTWGGIKALYR